VVFKHTLWHKGMKKKRAHFCWDIIFQEAYPIAVVLISQQPVHSLSFMTIVWNVLNALINSFAFTAGKVNSL
jgi:hypothetical protein